MSTLEVRPPGKLSIEEQQQRLRLNRPEHKAHVPLITPKPVNKRDLSQWWLHELLGNLERNELKAIRRFLRTAYLNYQVNCRGLSERSAIWRSSEIANFFQSWALQQKVAAARTEVSPSGSHPTPGQLAILLATSEGGSARGEAMRAIEAARAKLAIIHHFARATAPKGWTEQDAERVTDALSIIIELVTIGIQAFASAPGQPCGTKRN